MRERDYEESDYRGELPPAPTPRPPSYDEDDDEDGGWAIDKDHSDSLWDTADADELEEPSGPEGSGR